MTGGAPHSPPDHDANKSAEAQAAPAGLSGFVRAHPWITAIMLACTLSGAIGGPFVFDEAWPLARQIAAGAFLGAWVGMTITVTKMIG